MPIVKWDPFREIVRVDKDFGRWFLPEIEDSATTTWMPKTDIKETKNEIIVRTDLPGMELEDIDVSVEKDVLIIKGERKLEKEEKGKDFVRIERSYGSFYRTFRLEKSVKEDEIKASYKNGVLEVTLPKTEIKAAKKVKIEGKNK